MVHTNELDPPSRSNGFPSNGKAESRPATFSAITKSLFAKILQAGSDAVGQIEDVERQQQRDMAILVQSAAIEAAKSMAPSFQSLQKQLAELRQQQATVNQAMEQFGQLLNGELRSRGEEIRRLRSGELDREVRQPVLRRLCKRAKDAYKHLRELRDLNKSAGRDAGIAAMECIALDIVQDLSDMGVTPFSVEPNSLFDPARCELIRREKRPTSNQDLVGLVAEQEAPGFSNGDEVIEKATVFVFELKPSQLEQSNENE